MPTSAYFKPDVEVLQEFRNLNPLVLRATLQSVIVGPSYQKIKDPGDDESTERSIGSYTGEYEVFDLPNLSPGAEILESTLKVIVKNYAGEHEIQPTVLRTQGNSGSLTSATLTFVDNNQDFVALGVKASADVSDHDGDFVHILIGAHAGHYEIQQVVDSHTLVLDDPDGILALNGDAASIDYTIGNFGWLMIDSTPTTKAIEMSPRLSDSGVVYVSGLARRKDYTERFVISESVSEMEKLFDQPTDLTNPLQYGMAKALIPLGANEVILGLMVEDDTPESYQKAFEFLESEEVYCIVPLTTNPVVHSILNSHVTTMSGVEQKRERIGLFNTQRFTRVIREGYFGKQNLITGAWDQAQGDVIATGVGSPEELQASGHDFVVNGLSVAEDWVLSGSWPEALIVFRGSPAGLTISASPDNNPTVFTPVALDAEGRANFLATDLDGAATGIHTIRVISTAADSFNKVHAFAMNNLNVPGTAEVHYPVVVTSGTAMQNPYVNPTAGHKALKIKVFDTTNPAGDQIDFGALPGGMQVKVTYGNSLTKTFSQAGAFNFSGDIDSILITNQAGAVDADMGKYIIQLVVLAANGTYQKVTFRDAEGTFLSSKAVEGVDELVIINRSVLDEDTFSKYQETRYQIHQINSETELEINREWNAELGDWQTGEFLDAGTNFFYRIESPVITNKYDLAEWYRDISKSFANRRMTHIFAPAVGVSDDGTTITPIPGYYFSCVYAGATQADPPQDGFTNRPFAGFARVFFTNDYFTEAQLNVIAEGGTTIVIQSRALAPLTVRHQLTTDRSSIEKQEYSVTKNVDHMAKSARISFRPYIGRYLINETTLDLLYQLGSSLVERWRRNGQITGGSVDRFIVDPTQIDKVQACFFLKVPIPLNYIRLIFVI